ncbi:rrna-processing protein utp23 [Moniliophthora roreri MCA 2997]|uniref:U three protein 23 n=1 Tax=Moniliophthora roreri (strain MCA 2997) TaxID=1381753 RepID=V2Z330_MONRO|nr:rrna-processing protein utp23 [Moniliophthora roreri MCA 2997]
MRQKRAKAYRKLMHLYAMSFGFRQPYQVLVDSEICKEAIKHKCDLVKQLGSVLQGEVKPMITQCCITELYLQDGQQPAVDLAKTFERRKCNHREAILGSECLSSVVGDSNKHRYVIATQSQPLRSKLRTVPAVPLVHINWSVMVLEPPSDTTIKAKQEAEEKSLHAPASAIASAPTTTEHPRKKRKGPKGPNPLSVKKKQTVEQFPQNVRNRDQVVPSTSTDMAAQVGEKRKRDDNDGDEGGGDDGTASTSGRRRKRKRKTKQMPAQGSVNTQ